MALKTKNIGNTLIIYLEGRLDIHLCPEINIEIQKLIDRFPENHILLNLEDVEYMSSSGLRIVITTLEALNTKGKLLKLCNINHGVKTIFKVLNVMEMFDIYETEDKALKALNTI